LICSAVAHAASHHLSLAYPSSTFISNFTAILTSSRERNIIEIKKINDGMAVFIPLEKFGK